MNWIPAFAGMTAFILFADWDLFGLWSAAFHLFLL